MHDILQPTVETYVTPQGLRLIGSALGTAGRPCVILLHGGGQTRHSWRGTMEQLAAAGYRAVAYDARGHGDSDWDPSGEYDPVAQAEDLLAVRASIFGPVAIVGASMGGMTACRAIGASEARMADALVMVDIVPRPALSGANRIAAFMTANLDGFATLDDAVAAVTRYNPHRPAPVDPSGLMRNLRKHGDGRLYWHWDPKLVRSSANTQLGAFSDMVLEVVTGITIPTLLVHGANSDVVTEDGIADTRRLIPQVEVFKVGGAGHMIAGDRNDSFAEGIIGFLLRHLPVHG